MRYRWYGLLRMEVEREVEGNIKKGKSKWCEYDLDTIGENHITPKDYISLITKKKLMEV